LLQVGQVIGKKRAALAALEAECRVTCDEHHADNNGHKRLINSNAHSSSSEDITNTNADTVAVADVKKIAITGSASACETARLRIDVIASSIEVAVTVSEDLAMLIKANKFALSDALAAEYNVRIDLKPSTHSITAAATSDTKQKLSHSSNGNGNSSHSNSSSDGEQTLVIYGLPVHVHGMVRKTQVVTDQSDCTTDLY
jgi:hypothetical protein